MKSDRSDFCPELPNATEAKSARASPPFFPMMAGKSLIAPVNAERRLT